MTSGSTPPTPESTESEAAPPKSRRKGSVAPRTLRGRIVAGILLIIPLAVTAILIRYVYQAALSIGASVGNWAWEAFVTAPQTNPDGTVAEAPPPFINASNPDWGDAIMAIVLTILMLYFLGWLGTNVVGRRLIELAESIVTKIPFVDTIYGAIKRMVQALSGAGNPDEEGKRVVLVNFPDADMRAIAFMTNEITDVNSGKRYATVYVPTTPNPTSGYMEIVPVELITETDLTMEQALSMILSGGATSPPEIRLSEYRPGTVVPLPYPAPKDTP